MPRTKPIAHPFVPGSFDCRPEREACFKQYVDSKRATAVPKPLKLQSISESLEKLFVNSNQEYRSLREEQKEMMLRQEKQAKVNHNRSIELCKLQDKLRNRINTADAFIRECREKRYKSEDAVERESATQKQLKSEMKNIRESIKTLSEFRNELKATIELFKHYNTVLNEVIKISNIYVSKDDCVQRCDALMLAQGEITALIFDRLKGIEEMRKQIIKITNEAALTILGLKTGLSRVERYFNGALLACQRWEKIYAKVKATFMKNAFQKETSRNGIYMICEFLCRRRDIAMPFVEGETLKMLNFINYEVMILREILAEMDENENENFA